MTGVSEAVAALERGRAVLLVTPPAVEHAPAVWELLGSEQTIIICADTDTAVAWAVSAPSGTRVHPVTGLDRSARLIREQAVDILAATPEDLQGLLSRSALRLDQIKTVVLAWPEGLLAGDRLGALEPLFGELRDTRRIVLSWNPALLEDLLERYARRPHVVGDLPIGDDARPLPPVAPARYAVVPHARRDAAIRDALDALNRPGVIQWRRGTAVDEPADAILCLDLPNRSELAALAARGEVVLLLAPLQLPYARSIAAPLQPLPLVAARDRAAGAADALRNTVEARIETGNLEGELALLEPLLDRYDAAEVAAAILAISRQPSAFSDQPTPHIQHPALPEAWVKVFVNVGRKDRASAKDFVGALTREVGLTRTDIGRVELRDAFSLLEIAAPVADQAIAGLARTTIRGRRPAARRDRAG
ncbi:MAG TPA: DbpA RNA binding domain-containing protein [Gemmatimonadales bacterium]|nr:DbpA RNA binding domain-containing protein [Gemmatimonadales bacterium]